MQTFLIVLIIAGVVAGLVTFLGRLQSKSGEARVTMGEIDQIVRALKTTGEDESFAVVLVPGTAEDDGALANLQFSIEQGRLGFDWVLIAKRNIRDKDKVVSLIRSLGYTCSDRTLNGVDYVRCEDAWDFPGLAKKILTDLYGVDEKQSLTLIIMGFEWETPA